MLTADLVNVRPQKGELKLVPLKPALKARALEMGAFLIEEARAAVGLTRDELDAAWYELEVGPVEKRVGLGLRKLLEDHCVFDPEIEKEPVDLRRDVFLRASARRKDLGLGEEFNRLRVLEEVAREHGMDVTALERALYADLKGAHVLREAPLMTPQTLLDLYEESQAQGVLLRATSVKAWVKCSTPWAYRNLFRKMKFLRLLYTIHRLEDFTYRLDIDGPFSMFESTTKYGLQLALLLPHLAACDHFRLEADVLWGKTREHLLFKHSGGHGGDSKKEEGDELDHLPDEVAALVRRFRELESDWKVSTTTELLSLPGVGLCVPDLMFVRTSDRQRVFLEVMGFWSRAAVWKRVELVEQGLPFKIVFAASERLRVSEQALGEDVPGMLYMYKGVMNARAVLERLETLAGRVVEE